MAPGPYNPLGSGYPQGGPGAPAVKPFAAPVAPPPIGRRHVKLCVSKTSPSNSFHLLFVELFQIESPKMKPVLIESYSAVTSSDLQASFPG